MLPPSKVEASRSLPSKLLTEKFWPLIQSDCAYKTSSGKVKHKQLQGDSEEPVKRFQKRQFERRQEMTRRWHHQKPQLGELQVLIFCANKILVKEKSKKVCAVCVLL